MNKYRVTVMGDGQIIVLAVATDAEMTHSFMDHMIEEVKSTLNPGFRCLSIRPYDNHKGEGENIYIRPERDLSNCGLPAPIGGQLENISAEADLIPTEAKDLMCGYYDLYLNKCEICPAHYLCYGLEDFEDIEEDIIEAGKMWLATHHLYLNEKDEQGDDDES